MIDGFCDGWLGMPDVHPSTVHAGASRALRSDSRDGGGAGAIRDLKAVAAPLGHSSVRMADTVYVELYGEASRAVADAIDEMVRR